MAGILGALIQSGPCEGLTLGESMLIGRPHTEDGREFTIDREFLMKLRVKNKAAEITRLEAEKAALELEVLNMGAS